MSKWNETANLSLFSLSFFLSFFFLSQKCFNLTSRVNEIFFRPFFEFFSYKNEKKMIRKIFLVWVYYIR